MPNKTIENNVKSEIEKKETKKMPGFLRFIAIFLPIAIIVVIILLLSEAGTSTEPESNYTDTDSTSSSYTSSSYNSNYASSYDSYDYDSDKTYGAGGYEMPNENDDSFSDYVQRVDPDLYDAMEDNYNDAADDYYDSYDSYDYDYDYDSDKTYGAGGYEMPNESDDSFSDYVQRVDPELYDAIQDNYYDALY